MHYLQSAKARAIEDFRNKTDDELEEIIQEGEFTHVQGTPNSHDMNVITVMHGCMLHEVLKFRCNLTDKESLERCHVIPNYTAQLNQCMSTLCVLQLGETTLGAECSPSPSAVCKVHC